MRHALSAANRDFVRSRLAVGAGVIEGVVFCEDAILDRVAHTAHRIEFAGESMQPHPRKAKPESLTDHHSQ